MSGFDITKELEGLNEDEQKELLASLDKAFTETKARFVDGKRKQALNQKYELERNSLPANVSQMQKVRQLNELKRKYRAQGLEVW